MKKSLVIALALLFLILPFAHADGEHILTLKSDPYYNFVVRVQDSAGDTIDSVYGKANSSGDTEISFNTTREKVKFTIIVRFNGETVKTEETDTFSTSSPIFVELRDHIPEPVVENVTNSTEEANASIQENITQESIVEESNSSGLGKKIIGYVISEETHRPTRPAIITIIALVIAFLGIFGTRMYNSRTPTNIVIRPARSLAKTNQSGSSIDRIKSAEMKLEEARKEVQELKMREIEREERKIAKEQDKLTRLRGQNDNPAVKDNKDLGEDSLLG